MNELEPSGCWIVTPGSGCGELKLRERERERQREQAAGNLLRADFIRPPPGKTQF